jgi:four helix bundle protein
MKLQVHEMTITIIEALAPIVALIQRQDRGLAQQLRASASSIALNIAEAEYSDPGNGHARLFTAAGSANESRSAVRVAIAWRYVSRERAEAVLSQLDQVIAILWRLTHP